MNNAEVLIKFKGDNKDVNKTIESTKKSFNGLGNVAKTSFKTMGVAVAGAVATIGKIAYESTKAYAEFEQLEGGIETLFESASKEVMKNSKKAYKTAGLSANQYLNTVMGFSASLKQALNGDTQAMADYSDKAVRDMSDNANKMGTSMEMIQNAYQGFAKQNYTMLDNLKLGYGGTKTEMERLIADANKVKQANGEMADLSIDSFADIVEAIHVVQDEMGITGTTQKEASETIEGSLNSTKASWQNLILSFSQGEDEISEAFDKFLDSALTFGKNVLPVFTKAVSSIAKFLPKIADTIISALPGLLETLIPAAIDLVMQIITSIVNSLPTLLPVLVNGIIMFIQQLAQYLPTFITAIIQGVVTIVQSIAQALPTLIPTIVEAILNGILAILDNIDIVIDAGIQLMMGLVDGFVNAIPVLIDKIPEIIEKLINAIAENLPKIIEAGITLIVKLAFGLIKAIPQLVAKIPQIIGALIKGIFNLAKNLFEAGGRILTKIKDGIVNGIKKLPEIGKNIIKNIWNGIKNAISWLGEKIGSFASKIVEWFKKIPSKIVEVGTNLVKGLWNGIKNAAKWVLDKIKGFGESILNGIKSFFGIGSPSKLMEKEIGQWLPKGIAVGITANTDAVDSAMRNVETEMMSNFSLNPNVANSSALNLSPTIVNNNYVNVETDPLGQTVSSIKTFSGGAKNDYNYGLGV